MGRVARILSFIRTARNGANVSDVKVDRGGSDTRTLEHFSAPGDDAQPLPGDYVASVPQAGTGRDSGVGYVDPVNAPKAQPGDKRIYARDPDTGAVVCNVWLKSSGEVILANDKATLTLQAAGGIKGENDSGSYELTDSGDFVVNGATISAAGEITTALGIDLDTHIHPQAPDSAGDTQQPTGPPTP